MGKHGVGQLVEQTPELRVVERCLLQVPQKNLCLCLLGDAIMGNGVAPSRRAS
jgi:hypothetical protein